METEKIRNIAIIAHVDHGKTTLVDFLLKQAHVFEAYQHEMSETTILDSNELERERGVTILAKNTAITWEGYKINILDTPGHADFSGEVERVLNMADGCLLLVDAAEGVLSQTRYVLSLALGLGLKPIVIINKVDRKDQRSGEVLEEINDLFLDLATDPKQLEFPVLYAIGKEGKADRQMPIKSQNLQPLMQTIIEQIPAPHVSPEPGFQLQMTTLDYDSHKGRYVIGKVLRGQTKVGDTLAIVRDGAKVAEGRVEYLFSFKGLGKQPIEKTDLGDIVAITGLAKAKIGDTLTSPDQPDGLPDLNISEPTMKIQISPSTSPLVGQDGEFTTSRQIKQRLEKELETNVSLKLSTGATGESMVVAGRGELHLAILIETMRREGYEFSVAKPEVIIKTVDGQKHEPWELLNIEIIESKVGLIFDTLGKRKATLNKMTTIAGNARLEYQISTRNALGLRTELLTNTSGLAVIHSQLLGFKAVGLVAEIVRNGALVSTEPGQALAYSLNHIQERGSTFVEPGEAVYTGMIIGQNSRQEDMWVNVCKGKKLSNMRSATADATFSVAPPVKMSLEQNLNFLNTDELLEVTPKHLRLRKKNLNPKH